MERSVTVFKVTFINKADEVEILDLRDYPMPFFNEPVSPAMSDGKYWNEIVNKWSEKIRDGDAFIIVIPHRTYIDGQDIKGSQRTKKINIAANVSLCTFL